MFLKKINKLVNYFIVFILLIFCLYRLRTVTLEIINYQKVQNYFEKPIIKNKEKQYFGVLEIPKINLKKGFYNTDNKKNNVNKNIQLLDQSILPSKSPSMFILAAHSGYGTSAYFKNLDLLKINDLIYVYYNYKKYTYQIEKIYEIEKNGIINVEKKKESYLILTTCSEKQKNYQLIVMAILKNETTY